jgi:hypothetical protein
MLLSGCVDHDYDLSEIDKTITVGGNLNLPGSSTEEYTLSQILNLNDNSSIRAVAAGEYGLSEGDYVLEETSDPSTSTVSIEPQHLSNLSGSTTSTTLDPFYNPGISGRIEVAAKDIVDRLDIKEDNVNKELLTLSSAGTDIEMILNVGFVSNDFSGTAQINQGATATFDKAWTIEAMDQATKNLCDVVDNHILKFKSDKSFTAASPLRLAIRITKIDLNSLPQGQGLYSVGHFNLNSEVIFNAMVSIAASDIPTGTSANLNLNTQTEITTAFIKSVTGKVDPKIDIKPTSFAITGVPDFLTEPGNNLDIANPIISFKTENTSPVAVNVNAKIRAIYDDGSEKTIGIGDKNGTNAIVIEANATTDIFICREKFSYDESNVYYSYVIVPELSTLISTVPKTIELYDIEAKALDEEVTLVLGSDYRINSDYEATVPLAFGKDMVLNYTTVEDEWDEDLKDYNFKKAIAKASVVNTIPLTMKPSVIALDRNGNDMTNVIATINGTVDPGTLDAPSTSQLEIVLQSTGANLDGLDGVRIEFRADQPIVGEHLNAKQTIRFDDIKISIEGGVTIDLN